MCITIQLANMFVCVQHPVCLYVYLTRISVAIWVEIWFRRYACLVMSLGTYACCKHGPRHPMGGCGFAHRLSEVSIPAGAMRSLWRDRSYARGGPSGIDWFLGQDYSPVQWERLLLYLGSEPISSMPPWAKRLAWYMGLGDLDDYVCDEDFGWSADVQQYLGTEVTYGHPRHRPRFPFDLAHDRISSGMSLDDRMCRRMRYHGAH